MKIPAGEEGSGGGGGKKPKGEAAPAVEAVGDDLLGDIFLRLPDTASLSRAALACKRWRRVASDRSLLLRPPLPTPSTAPRSSSSASSSPTAATCRCPTAAPISGSSRCAPATPTSPPPPPRGISSSTTSRRAILSPRTTKTAGTSSPATPGCFAAATAGSSSCPAAATRGRTSPCTTPSRGRPSSSAGPTSPSTRSTTRSSSTRRTRRSALSPLSSSTTACTTPPSTATAPRSGRRSLPTACPTLGTRATACAPAGSRTGSPTSGSTGTPTTRSGSRCSTQQPWSGPSTRSLSLGESYCAADMAEHGGLCLVGAKEQCLQLWASADGGWVKKQEVPLLTQFPFLKIRREEWMKRVRPLAVTGDDVFMEFWSIRKKSHSYIMSLNLKTMKLKMVKNNSSEPYRGSAFPFFVSWASPLLSPGI